MSTQRDSFFKSVGERLLLGDLEPPQGELGTLLADFGAEIVIGHPTFRNERTIGPQIASDIAGAVRNFPAARVAIVITDGTWTKSSADQGTVQAAIEGASSALENLTAGQRENLLVLATPYEGYGGDCTPGKGSALKLIFEELAHCPCVRFLMLADGDLRNDMSQWQAVYKKVEEEHQQTQPDREFFITAKYARHFVDASLTRFIVGPLTTLLGTFVPGGISGDIVLSSGAVAHERGPWKEARRKYGTDISTTFDNLANPHITIYEVYLGAKLHDITDEAKLSVMPGEVVGAALERILHYRSLVENVLRTDQALKFPVIWGPQKTGISFIDPGYTDAFNVDTKIDTLVGRWPQFEKSVYAVLGSEEHSRLAQSVENLNALREAGDGPLEFLGLDIERWSSTLHRSVAYALKTEDIENTKQALNYLYTAAFVEFCSDRLRDLGLVRLQEVREAQNHLGVPADRAESFYRDKVDRVASALASRFYADRSEILRWLEKE